MPILDNFQTKMLKSETTSSITFPKGFRISNYIGNLTSGSGGKKTFKWYLKSEHMNGQADGQTDGQTDGHFNVSKASAQRAYALKTHTHTHT